MCHDHVPQILHLRDQGHVPHHDQGSVLHHDQSSAVVFGVPEDAIVSYICSLLAKCQEKNFVEDEIMHHASENICSCRKCIPILR